MHTTVLKNFKDVAAYVKMPRNGTANLDCENSSLAYLPFCCSILVMVTDLDLVLVCVVSRGQGSLHAVLTTPALRCTITFANHQHAAADEYRKPEAEATAQGTSTGSMVLANMQADFFKLP